jgi:tetratricopeptide (TPR) repeat protein
MVLADVELGNQRYPEAIAAYRKVLQQVPTHVAALNNLAYLAALHQGDSVEGLRLIDAALERTGPVAELLDTRGVVHLVAGDANRAVADLKAAAKQAPQGPTWFRLAEAQLKAGDRSGAEESFRKAVALGLKADAVHPLERKAFERLQAELGP